MILTKQIPVLINSNTVKYYESLGYEIPRHKDKYGRTTIKKGTKIIIDVKDLLPNSCVKVLCKCDICGRERQIFFKDYRSLCRKCSSNTIELKEKMSKIKKGFKHSEQTKIKMSQHSWMKGNGKNHPMYGKKQNEETKIKISNSLKGKMVGKLNPMFGKFGSDNPNWDNSISNKERQIKRNIPYMKKWRKEVKERDEFTCQCCGYVGKINDNFMIAHHMDNFKNFKEQRTDINNGVTLCKDCHILLHIIFGKITTRKDYNDFIKISK